jgi:hypothetical protein
MALSLLPAQYTRVLMNMLNVQTVKYIMFFSLHNALDVCLVCLTLLNVHRSLITTNDYLHAWGISS